MEVHVIPLSSLPQGDGLDKFMIYRPLAGIAFVGNRAMAHLTQAMAAEAEPRAANGRSPAVDFLQTIGFLRPDPPAPDPVGTAFRPTTAVLLLTNQCQLRCVYCYAAAGLAPKQELAPELGYAAIDYVCHVALDNGQPYFDVSFHGGGEPTYAWRTLQLCAAYARQKSLPARLSLTSNVVWSEAQREWIMANIDTLSLSIDGSPAIQDQQRPFASGHGSAAVIMNNLRELDEHGVPYGLRLTAVSPWTQIPEAVAHLCRETRCALMQLEPAFNSLPGTHGQPEEADCQAFAQAFVEAFEIAIRAGRRLYYSGARPGVVTSTFCTAPYNALIVNAGGDLVSCYEIDKRSHPLASVSTIGRIENGRVMIDQVARQRLFSLLEQRQERCRDCFCYYSCAGDCYVRTFQTGPQELPDHTPRCDMNREITSQMLLGMISGSGGVLRQWGYCQPANQLSPVAEAVLA
jgi:uncharacterized protein